MPSPVIAPATGPIRSRYADNPRLAAITSKFAARLAEQLAEAKQALAGGDFADTARMAHAIAGAAGTLGYDAFVAPARLLESLARSADAQGAQRAIAEMEDMHSRIEP